jgi:magnesium chelatase family protein
MSDTFAASVRGITLIGIEPHVVDVQATAVASDPGLHILGLADHQVPQTRDRIHAALANSGHPRADSAVTIGLLPMTLPKDTAVDLPIAIGLLTACRATPAPPRTWAFVGELGLDGHLRPVPGALPAALGAVRAGCTHIVVPASNASEAALAGNINVLGAATLDQVTTWLREGPPTGTTLPTTGYRKPEDHLDLQDAIAPRQAHRILEVAAAGHHHLSITGPPSAGGARLAAALPGLLPDLDVYQAREVTSLYSIAGRHHPAAPLMTKPPLQAPSFQAPMSAIIGGSGSQRMIPGDASLAHDGVLLLENATEFAPGIINGLHQVLLRKTVTINRGGRIVTFPACFLLAMTIPPCQCMVHSARCSCSPRQRALYKNRIVGPLINRVPLHIKLPTLEPREVTELAATAEPTAVVAGRVRGARDRAQRRLAATPWRTNSEIPHNDLYRWFPAAHDGMEDLQDDLRSARLTISTADHVLRVAWTLADLAGIERPGTPEIDAALLMTDPLGL